MLEHAMPGEALLSNGVPADHHLKQQPQARIGPDKKVLQEMADKLEKSEAGRKKLRQAISMLKEKVEANEKVLQVNEILRQECEKEKLRADSERNKAEEEKRLREQVEEEGSSTKEQLVRVLQRLDAVERNCKADHNEIERMRKEMKQAILGLGGTVKAIEAAHSSFESLEKGLLGKVSDAACASKKSASLAEAAIGDAKGAQSAAVAAEKLSESLVSRVAALQKQGASLDQRVTLLQQEILKRQSKTSDKALKSNGNQASNVICIPADKPRRGIVLAKNQQHACTRLPSPTTGNNECAPEGPAFSPKLTRAEVVNGTKPADRNILGTFGSLSPRLRNGAKGAGINGRGSFVDGQANNIALRDISSPPVGGSAVQAKSIPNKSRGNTVREALEAAKEKRKLQRTPSSNNVVLQYGKSSRCLMSSLPSDGTHAVKEYPVSGEEFRGRLLVDSSGGSVPALLENEKNNTTGHRTENTRGTDEEDNPERRPCIMKKAPKTLDDSGVETEPDVRNLLLPGKEKTFQSPKSGTKTNKNRDKREKLPVALLKDISKLFLKERKAHDKVEQKLADLQKMLQNGEDDETAKQGFRAVTLENSRKRKRRETLKEQSNVKVCVRGVEQIPEVKSSEHLSSSSQDHCVGAIVGPGSGEVGAGNSKSNNTATEADSTSRLQPPANKSFPPDPRGRCNDNVSEAGKTCQEIFKNSDSPQLPDVCTASLVLDSLADAQNVADPRQGMDIGIENVSGDDLSSGWDTDSEDELGEDWWTQERILLSPTLAKVQPPSLPMEGPDTNAPLAWPAAIDMNIEDFSLFLDVLPPIDQEVRDEERAVANLPDIAGSKSGSEEMHIESRGTALDGQRSIEQSGLEIEQPSSNLHKNCEVSPSNDLVLILESGSKLSDNSGSCREDEGKEIVIAGSNDNSFSSASRLEPSFCLEDVSGVVLGISKDVHDGVTVGSGSTGDDVLRDSKAVVKEEKVNATECAAREHVANLCPYTVELVVERLPQERVNSTQSSIPQGSRGSTTDISNEIMEAFGRTRVVLETALSHSNDDAFGSSLAVAREIASFFVSSTLSKSDLMCIFTASLVDSHALWDNKNNSSCLGSDCESLELLVDIAKQVLAVEIFQHILSPDEAFLLFAVQLQKFLIQGSIQAGCERISGNAFNEGCAVEQCVRFATSSSKLKRIKALISGGKLLAVLCNTIGNLGFLRSSIYSVLRFCGMETECLLAIISSLACMDYVSLFSVAKDDVVGQTVRVVVSELLHDTEVGRPTDAQKEENECQMEMQQGLCLEAERSADCTQLLQTLRALREIIGKEEGLSFECFVPRLVELFHGVITSTPGSHLVGNRHLFQRGLQMITCNKVEPRSTIDANGLVKSEQSFKTCQAPDVSCTGIDESAVQIGEKDYDRSLDEGYCWRDLTGKRSIHAVRQSEGDANVIEEWEQKFYDTTNALELVASHLGWEWTYNDFIVEHLWKLVSPGAPSMTVACVAHMFGLLGRLGREVDSTELPGLDELRKSLLVVLSLDQSSPTLNGGPKHNFSFTAQVAAAQALLVLSSSNRKDEGVSRKDPERVFSKGSELHAKSVKALWNWVQASKPEIQEILPSSLRCALLSIDKDNFVPIF